MLVLFYGDRSFFLYIAETNFSDDRTVQLESVLSKLNSFLNFFWALPRCGKEPEKTLGTMYH